MDDALSDVTVGPAEARDRDAINKILTDSWGKPRVIAHGRLYDLTTQPTLVARDRARGGTIVGVVTYDIVDTDIEVISIDAIDRRRGIGSLLLQAVVALGTGLRLETLWLVTTNDNLDALRFYQRRGLRITEVRPGAVHAARERKPSIPTIGAYGIPIRDEIVLRRTLPRGAEL